MPTLIIVALRNNFEDNIYFVELKWVKIDIIFYYV